MHNIYFYFDATPNPTVESDSNYIICGVAGELSTIVDVAKRMFINGKPIKGKRLVNDEKALLFAKDTLLAEINAGRFQIYGAVFYYSELPRLLKLNLENFKDGGNPKQRGRLGFLGHSFAQVIWILMENLRKSSELKIHVCMDNEPEAVREAVKYHIEKVQLRENVAHGTARVTIESHGEGQAHRGENLGYCIPDVICTMVYNYLYGDPKFKVLGDLITRIIKIESDVTCEEVGGGISSTMSTKPVDNLRI